MKILRIHLNYEYRFPAEFRYGKAKGVALPIKVLNREGTVLAGIVASSQGPTEVELNDEHQSVFVQLTWPSGRTETQQAYFSLEGLSDITFSDAHIARNDWSTWAIPRLNQRALLAESNKPIDLGIDRYAGVWLRIWRFEDSQWSAVPITPSMQYKNDAARQVDLHLEQSPHLLQIGGSDVPWRFIGLPGGGPCRVLLAANESNDPRADPLKIVATSFRTDAETLMEFLARDSVQTARTMATSEAMAIELFADKSRDPLAAVAGGYFLLRIGSWEQVPLSWWENLSNFLWVSDTAILHCIRLMRAGLSDEGAQKKALHLFKVCIDSGWPIYEEGLRLLQEAASLLKYIAKEEDAPYFSLIEALARAKSWAGAALSFYGREPAKPSAVLWVGMPDAPRRRQLAGRDWQDQVSNLNTQAIEVKDIADVARTSRQLTSLAFIEEFSPKNVEDFESDLYSGKRYTRPKSRSNKKVKTKSSGWILLGDIGS